MVREDFHRSEQLYQDNSTHHHYPENIKIEETKAPTDDSVRLLEEMQRKTTESLLAKVKVEDNLITGMCYCFESFSTGLVGPEVYYKFKINGKEFTIREIVDSRELDWDEQRNLGVLTMKLRERAKAVMLWYAMKILPEIIYEQVTGQKVPKHLMMNLEIKLKR